MNVITINFIECDNQPPLGYKVLWRVLGTSDPFTSAGNFFTSPAVFYDDTNPAGTQYEGTLQAQGADTDCDLVDWATGIIESPSQSGAGTYNIELTSPCGSHQIYSNSLITGGTPGDIVKVRLSFSGQISYSGTGNFIRADGCIQSPNGGSDCDQSTCYPVPTGPQGFTITPSITITMASDTELVTTSCVTHNSFETLTNAVVEIYEINGIPVSIQAFVCRGNSATGGNC